MFLSRCLALAFVLPHGRNVARTTSLVLVATLLVRTHFILSSSHYGPLDSVGKTVDFAVLASHCVQLFRQPKKWNLILTLLKHFTVQDQKYCFTYLFWNCFTVMASVILGYNISLVLSFYISIILQGYCVNALFFGASLFLKNKISQNTRSLVSNHPSKWETRFYAHLKLIRATEVTVSLFETQMALSTLSLLWYLVRRPYETFFIVVVEGKMDGVAIRMIETVQRFEMMFLLSYACESLNKEAEKFNMELFQLMRENKELCRNEKLQLFVTMKQTVNFTACGFFTIGYPLVTSVIAAATTYLVILVQFNMPSK